MTIMKHLSSEGCVFFFLNLLIKLFNLHYKWKRMFNNQQNFAVVFIGELKAFYVMILYDLKLFLQKEMSKE